MNIDLKLVEQVVSDPKNRPLFMHNLGVTMARTTDKNDLHKLLYLAEQVHMMNLLEGRGIVDGLKRNNTSIQTAPKLQETEIYAAYGKRRKKLRIL